MSGRSGPQDRPGTPGRGGGQDLRAMLAAVSITLGGLLAVYLTGAMGLEIERSMSISSGRLGLAVAAFFAASAVNASVAGRLADRFGSTAVLRVAVLPAIAALAALALVVDSWWSLMVAMVVAGAANGAIQPAANRFVTRTVPSGRQGFAFGVKQAAIPAATLLAGITVPAVALTVGWRWAFGGAAMLVAAFALAFPRRRAARAMAARVNPPDLRPAAGDEPFDRRSLLVLAVGQGLGAAATVSLGSFFVVAASSTGLQEGTAGIVAAAGSLMCLAVRVDAGRRADRRAGGHLRVVALLIAAAMVGLLCLAPGIPALTVPAALLAYGAGWGWPGLFNFGVARLHPDRPGRATGILQVGASTGGAVGPLAFGFTAGAGGFGAAWLLAAGAAGLGSALVVAGSRLVEAGPSRSDHAPGLQPGQLLGGES